MKEGTAVSTTELDVCIDGYLPGQRYDPALLPRLDDLRAPPEELAVAWRLQWQVGQDLRICLLDGTPELHQRVRDVAGTWLDYANVGFSFGNYADAEIRVSFRGSGYWSLVGTDALRAPRNEATLQLGGFTADVDEETLHRVVLHEFGHAIGCIHEQASPAGTIPWNEPRVYDFYRQWAGWSDDEIYHNVLLRYSGAEVTYSNFDPSSIMQYPVPAELTIGDFEIGWNTELSEGDKSFIARMYPRTR